MTNRTLIIRSVVLAWLASLCGTGGTAAQDSTVTVRGVLQVVGEDDRHQGALLTLVAPVAAAGGNATILTLVGSLRRFTQSDGYFVEVSGFLGPALAPAPGEKPFPSLRVARLRNVDPEGIARRTVVMNFTDWVVATLAVVPPNLRWRDSADHATGIAPSVLYTVTNNGKVPLFLEFPSSDFVCVSVTPETGMLTPPWRYVWKGSDQYKLAVKMGATFRSMIPIPEAAAPRPGLYTVRAGLCGRDDYELQVRLEVAGAG